MDDFDVIDMTEKYGQAQTIYVWDSTKSEVVADVATISADGTGEALLTGLTFEWAYNADGGPEEEGKIVQVEFSNGTQAQYLSIRDIDDLASDLFWEINTPNGDVLMGAGASIFADPDYAVTEVTEADVVGRFYQFGVGEEVSGDSRLKGFRMRFDAGGTGAQEEDYIDGSGNVVILDEESPDNAFRAFRWSIVPDNGVVGVEVVVRRTWDTVNEEYNCVYDNGVTPSCVLFDERRIMPIVVNDTGRYYWIEVRRSDDLEVTEETPATHLARFYDYEPLEAEQAVSMAKPRISRDANKPRELLRGPTLR
jgi:hypothetical protein